MRMLIVAVAVILGEAALAQLRITSFDSSGELTWTNPIQRGLYSVESGSTLSGPWSPLASVVDKDGSKTNRISFQVATNTPAFYRVAWIPPDPNGVWDYRGFDHQGTLVITGQLILSSTTLLTSNPPVVYRVGGSRHLAYAGPPTNTLVWLGPHIGTGYLSGTIELETASLVLRWPTNVYDYNMYLGRDLWSNTYTGVWGYTAVGPVSGGIFSATRMPSTNQISSGPDTRESRKGHDNVQ